MTSSPHDCSAPRAEPAGEPLHAGEAHALDLARRRRPARGRRRRSGSCRSRRRVRTRGRGCRRPRGWALAPALSSREHARFLRQPVVGEIAAQHEHIRALGHPARTRVERRPCESLPQCTSPTAATRTSLVMGCHSAKRHATEIGVYSLQRSDAVRGRLGVPYVTRTPAQRHGSAGARSAGGLGARSGPPISTHQAVVLSVVDGAVDQDGHARRSTRAPAPGEAPSPP